MKGRQTSKPLSHEFFSGEGGGLAESGFHESERKT